MCMSSSKLYFYVPVIKSIQRHESLYAKSNVCLLHGNLLHQARRNEIHIGEAEMRCERSEQKREVRGLTPGKIFHDHAL